MALLKKKQSRDQYHSRKSSLNSTISSASSSHSIVPKCLNDEKGNHSPLSPLIGTTQNSSKSQPVTRNGSRMSSAPTTATNNNSSIPNTPIFQTSSNHSHVNSAAKRFSLSLRSFHQTAPSITTLSLRRIYQSPVK